MGLAVAERTVLPARSITADRIPKSLRHVHPFSGQEFKIACWDIGNLRSSAM
jgi:hypothetical protein